MRKLLNTLYVTTPDTYIAREGQNVVLKVKDVTTFRVPVHNLEGIICFGYVGASPALMQLCSEKGVGLTFLTMSGKFIARLAGPVSGNVLLRRKQYTWADREEEKLRLSKRFVEGKIHNSRVVLQRVMRDHEGTVDSDSLRSSILSLKNMVARVEHSDSVDVVRGLEGEAANSYFSCFSSTILTSEKEFRFEKRNRRPPTDPVNALLSFAYTLLEHEYISALETVGLDPQVGFLHSDRPGRRSLALDMMEEMRPYMADRFVLSLINRKQVSPKGFKSKDDGAILMNDRTRRDFIVAWQNRKKDEINHPFLNEKIPVGLIPYVQAMLLARNIRGDMVDYPPFLWK